ncbi:GNAT family N-acetyltransferase [uncultured Flavobacterium sp.]|uniref:GNAT family N-acetyltransferase n=1 Tax=uncultured Flavobacterium sp. TaxID=165435 RepID=UPI0030C7D429
MNKLTVKRYTSKYYSLWNEFVSKAKNATFLFHRDFMEYHTDRFDDYSLLIFDEKDTLISILPANKVEQALFSHQGLTYGGFILLENVKLVHVISIFKSVLNFLHQNDISKLQLKQIPPIYWDCFTSEIDYCLFITKSQLIRRDSLAVIDTSKPYRIAKSRRENIRRGAKNNLEIREELNFELFWNEILIPNLEKKHQAKPVHTIQEITLLQKRFPKNIRHFNVYDRGKIVAGTTVFISEHVAHPQYISGNEAKNELGSLDYLYHHLMTEVFKNKKYFDLGPSNENQGKNINEGLLFWKESFGAKIVVQDFYEVETANFGLLDTIML